MINETIDKSLENEEEFLLDMVEYYIVDPKNRINRDKVITGHCKYPPITDLTEGCAIGRKCSKELALEMDESDLGPIANFLSEDSEFDKTTLPPWMFKFNKSFLSEVQNLHDDSDYWDLENKCLTEAGKACLSKIIFNYNLNKERFLKFL